jgi:hypothetical protein
MFVALVAALMARVTPCEYREVPFNGANIRNAAKSRQGGDDPLGPRPWAAPSRVAFVRARASPTARELSGWKWPPFSFVVLVELSARGLGQVFVKRIINLELRTATQISGRA